MSKLPNTVLRGVQFLWTLLILALIGNAIALRGDNGSPATTNYVMFTAAWSMLTLVYTFPASFIEGLQGHAIIPLILDALNVLFTFCAAVALAAKLRVHSCFNYAYTNSNGVINYTSDHQTQVCQESQASDAFLWFLFAAYVGSLFFSVTGLRSGGSGMRGGVGGIRRGPPAMSQV